MPDEWWKDSQRLRQAIEEYGSVRAAARATGAARSTLRDWVAKGAGPSNRGRCPGAEVGVGSSTPTLLWGTGAATLSRPATTEDWELVVFLSDIHYPYHDQSLVESALRLLRTLRPHRVVLNGDINDFFQLSHFNKSNQRLDDLQDEIDQGTEFRRLVREAVPNARIDETIGNHEDRLTTYVGQNARALSSLRCLEPSELLRHAEYEIEWHQINGFLLRPWFLVKHGTIVRGEAGATAKAELMQAGVSGLSGHTHRLATYRKVGYTQRQWTEQGCLCRLDPDYVKSGVANWSQGVVVGEFSTRGESFQVYEVPASGGELRLLSASAT